MNALNANMRDPVWEKNYDKLYFIAKAFYQAYRHTGLLKMKFGLRTIPDSDGSSVVDVYISPRDHESAETMMGEENAKHMQFLESMVPSTLLGYQFILQIQADGMNDIHMEPLEIISPLSAGTPVTGPGLVSEPED